MKPIETSPYGMLKDGREVHSHRLTNDSGASVRVMDWGASLLEVMMPGRDGNLANVNLTLPDLDGYVGKHPGFGSTIGRFANRLAHGRFEIDGKTFQVVTNHGEHCLHGGNDNFKHRLWTAEPREGSDNHTVSFELVSPDGDQGFPGRLSVTATYGLSENNVLTIRYEAVCEAPTVVNLTNHSYWNLGGAGSGTALDHTAIIHSRQVLAVDEDLIPTGDYVDVVGTPFDFTEVKPFGRDNDQLPATGGYDHCFVIDGPAGQLRPAARVVDPASGRFMEIETTQPGMQLYLANHLGGAGGYRSHEAFCVETQYFPDAPNHPGFKSTVLRPGQKLTEVTVHRFGMI